METLRKYAWPGWVATMFPWLTLLLLIAGALHVRLGLGYWPDSSSGAYGSRGWAVHAFLIMWTGAASAVVAPTVWIVLLFFRDTRFSEGLHVIQAAVYVTGWGLIVLCMIADPMKFISWWLD